MRIYAVSEDRLILLLADKKVTHAIKTTDRDLQTVTIMLDKLAVQIAQEELHHLLNIISN